MRYKNFFRLLSFSFTALTMIVSSPAIARDGGSPVSGAQTAGAQLSGVDVSLEEVAGGKVLTTRTDERGSFTFSDVAPGSYKLRIGCAGTGARGGDATAGAGVRRCYAEFRVGITDKSRGVVTGAIRREGS
jgi:hypothetical protein